MHGKFGGSPVVCVGGSNKTEKMFKCKAAYCYKGDKKANCPLCPFKFTVKLDNYGSTISLLLLIHVDWKTMVAHDTIAKTIKRDKVEIGNNTISRHV